jgi:hypothetical protein
MLLFQYYIMRVNNEEILHELKMRLADEKSLKQKVLLKQLIELADQL